jgi:hypothetical protein
MCPWQARQGVNPASPTAFSSSDRGGGTGRALMRGNMPVSPPDTYIKPPREGLWVKEAEAPPEARIDNEGQA